MEAANKPQRHRLANRARNRRGRVFNFLGNGDEMTTREAIRQAQSAGRFREAGDLYAALDRETERQMHTNPMTKELLDIVDAKLKEIEPKRTPVFYDYPQGSTAWHRARLGKATSSEFKRIVTPAKLARATGADTYLDELIAEYRLLMREHECPPDVDPWAQFSWTTKQTEWGKDREAWAIEQLGVDVEPVGFIEYAKDAFIGASTDGLIGTDGIVEIKNPWLTSNVIKAMRRGMTKEHNLQIQGELWVSDRQWCLHAIGDYRTGDIVKITVERDDKIIGLLSEAVLEFEAKLKAEILRLF